jgi:hypothetical protein
MGFTLFVVEAVYGRVVSSLASRFIESRFILRVMTALEYGIVVFMPCTSQLSSFTISGISRKVFSMKSDFWGIPRIRYEGEP